MRHSNHETSSSSDINNESDDVSSKSDTELKDSEKAINKASVKPQNPDENVKVKYCLYSIYKK